MIEKGTKTYAIGLPEPTKNYARTIRDILGSGDAWDSGAITVGRVYLVPIQIPFKLTIDQIGYHIGPANAGNVFLGIYEDNGDTPVGGALLGTTASTAVPAVTNQKTEVALTSILILEPGLYWLCIEGSDAGLQLDGRIFSQSWQGGTLQSRYYDRAGGYGTPTDPCPATTIAQAYSLYSRIFSIP